MSTGTGPSFAFPGCFVTFLPAECDPMPLVEDALLLAPRGTQTNVTRHERKRAEPGGQPDHGGQVPDKSDENSGKHSPFAATTTSSSAPGRLATYRAGLRVRRHSTQNRHQLHGGASCPLTG